MPIDKDALYEELWKAEKRKGWVTNIAQLMESELRMAREEVGRTRVEVQELLALVEESARKDRIQQDNW